MTTWTDTDLAHFGDAQEVRIACMRRDGSLRSPVIVWVVPGDLPPFFMIIDPDNLPPPGKAH